VLNEHMLSLKMGNSPPCSDVLQTVQHNTDTN